jgi:hypothetical protein
MHALGLARLAEVEVGAVGTAVANPTDGDHAARVTLASPVDAAVALGIVLRHPEEKADDVMASSLLGRIIARIVPPFFVGGLYDGLAVTHGLCGRDVLSLRVVGIFRVFVGGQLGGGRAVAVSVSAGSPPASADGVASVKAAARQSSIWRGAKPVLIGVVPDRGCGDGRDKSNSDSRPSERLGRWSREPHGYCCSIVAARVERAAIPLVEEWRELIAKKRHDSDVSKR